MPIDRPKFNYRLNSVSRRSELINVQTNGPFVGRIPARMNIVATTRKRRRVLPRVKHAGRLRTGRVATDVTALDTVR